MIMFLKKCLIRIYSFKYFEINFVFFHEFIELKFEEIDVIGYFSIIRKNKLKVRTKNTKYREKKLNKPQQMNK